MTATMSKSPGVGMYPPVAKLNMAADPRKMRRIIAEDPEWSLTIVPLLSSLCLQHIVINFEGMFYSIYSTLFIQSINQVTANLINDEGYWKRCCKQRWGLCDVSSYGHSWKRMFFERHLENIIELFIPDATDPKTVLDMVPLSRNYVKRLDISQLLPPIKEPQKSEDDDNSDSASDMGMDGPSIDHFDFGILLDKLSHLEELHVVYRVKGCGMNFEWNLFEFTFRDCESLAKALKSCKTLRVLRIHQSKVDDEKCRQLVNNLLDHPSLRELNLSHNLIGDRAYALAKNSSLLSLNLRLNRLGDEGGQAIAQALLKNRTLEWLHLGGNEMTEPTATVLSQVLVQNNTLRSINLSCNRLGIDGGKVLEEGMSHNSSMVECDIRLTEVGQESDYCISQVVRNNQNQAHRKRNTQEINTK
ncbi:unnamed protein product [Coregonus sp. 'balchen']|nr:unnamed protein product [Coregonus sp. 'balchen']